jgi:5-methylcytosine-specific restriction endonuclease McrA
MIKDGLLEVDHIKQIGSFTGCFDKLVRDMYCGQGNLQALCLSCHERKTTTENAKMRFQRKNAEDYL